SLEMELSLDMDMSNFEEKSMSDYATDIGGIAGTSSGVIRECTNNEKVGYQKMGYNIGGIVGSQNGYVAECINNAEINGMDGVGGIVGYFKPSVVLEFGPNPMDTMSAQMNSMMSSMENLMTMPSIDGVDMESIEEALDILQDTEGEIDEDTINAALNDLSDAFGNIYNADYDPTTKVDELKSTMQGMMGSMGSMSMSMEFNIVDVSKDDTENDTIAKVANCVNYGEVKGQTHIAGITGLADMEMTSLLEAMGQESQMSNSADLIVRLVIRNCKNHATISANKNYVGGIVGEMVFGAVIDSKNVGNLDAISANYVGGIAGSCETAIMNSFSKAIIAGADYVGGIAGYGIEVTDCYAFSDIAAYTKFAGGILGSTNELPDETDGLIQNTYYYYVGTDLGGIDGINYEGATGRISFEEFVALENLDDMFKTVDVRFVVDGQEDVVLTIDLGRDVELEDVPIVEVSEADRYDWEYVKPVTSKILGMNEVEEIYYLSENRLSHIYFDQTYQAVIDAKHMVSEGTNTTADGRKVVLAVGAFDQATTVTLTDVLKQNPEVNGVPVIENWQVSISNIGVEKLHYRIPEGVDAENLVLYVRDQQGNWSEREFSVEASFMIFAFSDNEFGFALEERADYSMMITIGVGVVVAGLLLIILKKKFSKSKSKKNEKVA
ncbi:MAG: hypothetical protein IJ958_03160, partial [Agathobacter sp.]|nr:hypothetical protein [Agathobacter sp.]